MLNTMPKPQSLIAFLMLTSLLIGCSNEPQLDKKTKLMNTLTAMETAIEAKGVDEFFTHVSDDFVSQKRGWGKKDAERILRIRLMKNKTVHVHQMVKRVEWLNNGDQQAEVEVVAAMAGTDISLNDLPSFRGDMVKFIVTFELINDDYIITQTEWQRANPADFVF